MKNVIYNGEIPLSQPSNHGIIEWITQSLFLRNIIIEDVSPIITEINKKLSFSFASLCFVIIGLPLAIWTRRRERFVGIGLSIGVFVAYYILFLAGEVLSIRKFIYPGLSMWLADIVLICVGLILIPRTMKR